MNEKRQRERVRRDIWRDEGKRQRERVRRSHMQRGKRGGEK